VTVWLVRHAEDLGASEQRFGDLPLSPTGRDQARAVAVRLAKVPFRGCLVSPMRRAVETAQLLLEGRDVPLELDSDLAEGALGDLDGLTRAEARRRYPRDFRFDGGVVQRIAASGRTAPGGETRDVFLARVGSCARRVQTELARDGELLLVAHGGLLNYLLQVLLRMPLRDELPFGFEHAGLVALRQEGDVPGYGPFPSLVVGVQGADQANPV
jgi:probable phosphoglycerate mutase